MRTKNLNALREAIDTIHPKMVGHQAQRDVVSRALHVVGAGATSRFGLPAPLVGLLDVLFRHLPWAEARATVSALPDAIGWDGRDLRPVSWLVLAAEMIFVRDCTIRADTPHREFVRNLSQEAEHALRVTAVGHPWSGGLALLDRSPARGPKPNGSTGPARLASIDHAALGSIGYAVRAVLATDTAIAATVRRRYAAAEDLNLIDPVCRSAQDLVRMFVERAAEEAAETALAAAEEQADDLERRKAGEMVQQACYRRQGATVLHLVRRA